MTAVNRGIQKNVHSHAANTVLISEGDMAPKRLGMMSGREGLLIYGHHAVVFYIFLRKLVSGKLENVYVSNRNVRIPTARKMPQKSQQPILNQKIVTRTILVETKVQKMLLN